MKICKYAGTLPGPPVGTVFNFTVSGAPGTTSVNLGNCAFVLGANGLPMQFPFNSTQLVTESASALNAASAISALPTFVQENGASTTALVQSGVVNLGSVGTASSISVVIGEDTLTEVSFTDVDPPVAGSSPVTVAIPGGSNLGTTTAAGIAVATTVASSSAVTSAAASVAAVNTAAATSARALTPKQEKALLKMDKALLKSIQSKIVAAQHRVAHTTGKAHRAALSQLSTLRARQHVLKLEISLL
jgi:hypothetical protein